MYSFSPSDAASSEMVNNVPRFFGYPSAVDLLVFSVKLSFPRKAICEFRELSNHWICYAGQGVRIIGVDANENLLVSSDPPSNGERDEHHD